MVRPGSCQVGYVQPCEQDRAGPTASADWPERTSFAELFADYFAYVWHSLRRLGVPERDLEDVTHDVFIRVYRRLDTRDPARPLRPWLFGFALRVAAEYRRLARNRFEVFAAAEEPVDPSPNGAEQLERSQHLAIALSLLDAIPIDRRAVFILHELDGCSIPDVAEGLGIKLPTAYTRLRLAREELRELAKRWRARGANR
jgi:RNA polymerase sigma-70 factor (ECF subfamily)